ncbi:MAG: hypothetical protein AABW85_03645 [archaeon]
MNRLVKAGILLFALFFAFGCLKNSGLAVSKEFSKEITPANGLTDEVKNAVEKSAEVKKAPEKPAAGKKLSFLEEVKAKLIPSGKPEYSDGILHFGAQLNSMNRMLEYNNGIVLEKAGQERFEKISAKAFCEFCCGPVPVRECGCNHSAAYRGIIKYLVKNFPDYTDEKIIAEQEKWRASFFQEGTIYKYLKGQKALGKVSEEEIKRVEEVIGSC